MSKRDLRPPGEWDDLPSLNPYPEFQDELYDDFRLSGLQPENLTEPGRTEYRSWLREKGYDTTPELQSARNDVRREPVVGEQLSQATTSDNPNTGAMRSSRR